MKLSKFTRAKVKMSTAAERKSVVKAAKTMLDYGLISPRKASMIARNLATV